MAQLPLIYVTFTESKLPKTTELPHGTSQNNKPFCVLREDSEIARDMLPYWEKKGFILDTVSFSLDTDSLGSARGLALVTMLTPDDLLTVHPPVPESLVYAIEQTKEGLACVVMFKGHASKHVCEHLKTHGDFIDYAEVKEISFGL